MFKRRRVAVKRLQSAVESGCLRDGNQRNRARGQRTGASPFVPVLSRRQKVRRQKRKDMRSKLLPGLLLHLLDVAADIFADMLFPDPRPARQFALRPQFLRRSAQRLLKFPSDLHHCNSPVYTNLHQYTPVLKKNKFFLKKSFLFLLKSIK